MQPARVYGRGAARRFADLPAKYRANLNDEPPFGGKPGDEPVLSDADVADIAAFLRTLTDGYAAARPADAALARK